jgi:acetoacetyl-CoA synthetase
VLAPRTSVPIFEPDATVVERSQLTAFMRYCERETNRSFADYAAFHEFSVAEFRQFWRLFLVWSKIPFEGTSEPVCVGELCEYAQFFPYVRVNYAEVLLRANEESGRTAVTACHFGGQTERLTGSELRLRVARLAIFLESLGVGPGDRIAVIARNGLEAVVAALAAASVGAVFSSCAPDMGAPAILSRLAQLDPNVLIGHLRTAPWEVGMAVGDRLAAVARQLPTLKAIIALDDGPAPDGLTTPLHRLADIVAKGNSDDSYRWRRFPFNHPLFILFSSGTTGSPKCIMHSAGGTLLEHLKEHRLHCDLRRCDKLFFQTSCAWMMWNWQLTALASGAELVLYDGPSTMLEALWRLVEREAVTVFGTNPTYLQLCERTGFEPAQACKLTALRSILSTGSILYPRQYDWVHAHVKELPLQSISGGTDIIGCFVLGNPNLPVHRGEAQCRSLALDVRSLPPADEPNASIGELICANPFPSRPIGFFRDHGGERFHAAYFHQNPGVWTHGDLIEFTSSGGARLHGRSDGVLNVRGIRIGPAEIYNILQDIDEVVEGMAVEQFSDNDLGGSRMVLLLVLRPGSTLDDALIIRIRSALLQGGSAVFVPALITQVPALPLTHNGKRSEAAARDALNGRPVRNREALQNPDCLETIARHAASRHAPQKAPTHDGPWVLSREQIELDLRQICAAALGLQSIGTWDNLFAVGADSLTIVNILLQIDKQFGRRLPLTALFEAPTVGDLASLVFGDVAAVSAAGDCASVPPPANNALVEAVPQIRPARASDIQAICRLLDEGFRNEVISSAEWRALFDYAWLDEKPNFGFVIAAGDRIVGFLGAIYAERRINNESVTVSNLTSWYVRPEYRGWGVTLMAAAVRDAAVAHTALTPAPITRQILRLIGFKSIDTCKILLVPFVHSDTLCRPAPSITFDPTRIGPLLSDKDSRIFRDHLPYDCLHAVVSEGADYCYVVAKRRVRRRPLHSLVPVATKIPYSELLYCSAPKILQRHLERIKLAIMRRQRTIALVVDEHLSPALRSHGIAFRNEALYRATTFDPRMLDKLYSELVLLPL